MFIFIIFTSPTRAQNEPDSLRKAAKSDLSDTNTVVACNTLAEEIVSADPKEAIALTKKALDISLKINFKDGITWSYSTMAEAFENAGEMDSAIACYENAQRYKYMYGDTEGVAKMDMNIGVVYLDQGYYQPASEKLYKAMAIFEKLKNKQLLSRTYNNLGLLYRRTKNYKSAIDFYKKSLQLKKELGDLRGQALTRGNISSVLLAMEEYASAEKVALENYEFCQENDLMMHGVTCLVNLSQTCLRQNKMADCEKYLALIKPLLEKYPDDLDRADYLLAKSEFEKSQNRLKEASNSALQATELFKNRGTLEQLQYAYAYMSSLYASIGNSNLAIEYLNKSVEIRDTIFHRDNMRQVNEMNIIYKTQSKEKENDKLRMENKLEQVRSETSERQRNILLVSLAIFLLLGLWISRLLWQKNKAYGALEENKKALEIVVEQKDTLLRELHHRVKNNLQVVTGLLDLQMARIHDEDVIKALNDGKNRIRSMALIHQKLYRTDDLKSVDMQEYLEKLLNEIKSGFASADKKIHTGIEAPDISLDIDVAIPLGLMVNELVTNSFKYAFEGRSEGNIKVSLYKINDKHVLKVSDDGPGYIPAEKTTKATLGLRLVNMLTKQIRGTVEIHNFSGTEVEIQF